MTRIGRKSRLAIAASVSVMSVLLYALSVVVQVGAQSGVGGQVQISPLTNVIGFTETAAAADPTNGRNLFVGSNLGGGTCTSGYPVQGFRSGDSGSTWSASSTLPTTASWAGDPAPAFDAAGTLFYSYLDDQCANGVQSVSQLVIVKSTDKGATWANPAGGPGLFKVIDTNKIDKPALTIDTTNSAYQNRLYAGYVSISSHPWHLFVSYSSDHGATWTIPNPYTDGGDDTGASLDVGPTGNLFASWWDMGLGVERMATSTNGGGSFTSVTNVSPATSVPYGGYRLPNYGQGSANPIYANTSLAVDRSSSSSKGNIYLVYNDRLVPPAQAPTLNAASGGTIPAGAYQVGYTYVTGYGETAVSPTVGVTLNTGQNAIQTGALTGIPSTVTNVNYYLTSVPVGVGVNTGYVGTVPVTGGTANGLLITSGGNSKSAPQGQMHVFLARSTNGGVSFPDKAIRLDTGNPNDAWEPTAAVDQSTGRVSVAWYDRRDDPVNKLYHVYYTESSDGGSTFLPQQIPISTGVNSDPTTHPLGTGDYMGIASVSGQSHPVWVDDTSNNVMGVWTAAATERAWTKLNPTNSPSPRAEAAAAYDSGRNKVILFGGNDGSNDLAETWSWDGSNWSQLHPSGNPSSRHWPAMAYNSNSGAILLFGGIQSIGTSVTYEADTWLWNGTNWSNVTPKRSPPPRGDASMTFDAARGVVVLFGGIAPDSKGSGYHSLNDTWTWDGTNWTQQTPTTAPSIRAAAKMVYDPIRSNSMLFSGVDSHPPPPPYNQPDDTWTWDGSNWTQKNPATNPPARYSYGAAFDSASSLQRTIMFGGASYNNTTGVYSGYSDTWDWDGSVWSQENLLTSPSPRADFTMVYVANGGYMLLFGGRTQPPNPSYFNETWVLTD